ncbi:MAG: hypothetical protein ACPGKU_08630 [Candidatus Puniceispirillaceae bacterium]
MAAHARRGYKLRYPPALVIYLPLQQIDQQNQISSYLFLARAAALSCAFISGYYRCKPSAASLCLALYLEAYLLQAPKAKARNYKTAIDASLKMAVASFLKKELM